MLIEHTADGSQFREALRMMETFDPIAGGPLSTVGFCR